MRGLTDIMHEVSIAESILDLIEGQIGVPRHLTEVELCVGPLSGVSAESLEFCFATVAKERGFGSPLLQIRRTQVVIHCDECLLTYSVDDLMSFCPVCSSRKRTIRSGQELQLVSALLEDSIHV